MKKTDTIFPGKVAFFHLFFLMITIALSQQPLMAKSLVTGHYGSASGKRIILNLHISNPAPTNLIVEQYLSPGNEIKSTSPGAKKISSGNIKWLFRNTSSGTLSISIQLKSNLKGNVRAIVRYRDPASGQFIEQQVSS